MVKELYCTDMCVKEKLDVVLQVLKTESSFRLTLHGKASHIRIWVVKEKKAGSLVDESPLGIILAL